MLKARPTKKFCKSLEELPEKIFNQVWSKILSLCSDPCPQGFKKIDEVDGMEVWRVHSGEYRIIYAYDDENLFLILMGKRNDKAVYKEYKRQK